jgi:hypothetical protein
MDLAVEYAGAWNIIEIKLLRQGKTFETVMGEGCRQILGYRERLLSVPARCYLLIFDRRPDKPSWDERLRWIDVKQVTVVGC